MLDRIEFLLGEAFIALRRNFLMTMAAITTAAMALFLLGGLGYIYMRVTQFTATLPPKYEMRVYLREGVDVATIKETAKKIRSFEGVAKVQWIPKEIAWDRFKKEHPSATEGYDVGNPLPDGFKVILSDLSMGDEVAAKLQAMPTTEINPPGVIRNPDVERMVKEIVGVAQWVGGFLGTLMLVTACALIYNAIRLTVIARRREIRIMQLVGASHFTVRTPFIIEGLVQGAIGGLIAALFIAACNVKFYSYFQKTFDANANPAPFPIWPAMGILAAVGAFFGLVCSFVAVRDPLKFRQKAAQQ